MANDSRPSFIPRRTPTAPKKQRNARSIGVFGYLSYILFFGSILLSMGMFVVSQQVQSTLQEKQTELTSIKDQFQQSEMDRIREYENFLEQTTAVFGRSISIGQLFTAIEGSVVKSAFLTEMTLERTTSELMLEAAVQSDSFDTALFQRSVYEEFPILTTFTLDNVALLSAGQAVSSDDDGDEEDPAVSTVTTGSDVVNFELTFDLDADSLPFSPQVVPAGSDADAPESAADETAVELNSSDT